MKRRFFLLLFPLFLFSGERVRLLLDWYPNPDHVPIYAGKEKGFFREEGIDLELIKLYDPIQTMALVEMGRVDIAIHVSIPLMRVACRTKNFKIIGTYVDKPLQGVTVRADSGILTPKDLDGKVISAKPDGSVSLVLGAFAKKEGIAFKEIKKIPMDLTPILATGAADGVSGIMWNVDPVMLDTVGVATRSFRFDELGAPVYPELLLVCNKKYAKQNPQTIAKFLRALEKSNQFSVDNEEESFSLYAKALPTKSPKTIAWERKSWAVTAPQIARKVAPDEKSIQTLYDWMEEGNFLKEKFSPTSLIHK
ncbi:MAG: ABC transporter substrate-binding protein [Candidatus Algichlamydia australiensis]|nr:ABC transporter substrate-binding protein [Chlamydiales bacterium]